jgi:hypothetical protein
MSVSVFCIGNVYIFGDKKPIYMHSCHMYSIEKSNVLKTFKFNLNTQKILGVFSASKIFLPNWTTFCIL